MSRLLNLSLAQFITCILSDELCEASRTLRGHFLILSWNLVKEIKDSPPDCHHLSLPLIYFSPTNIHQLVLSSREDGCILIQHKVARIVRLGRREMDRLTFEQKEEVMPGDHFGAPPKVIQE